MGKSAASKSEILVDMSGIDATQSAHWSLSTTHTPAVAADDHGKVNAASNPPSTNTAAKKALPRMASQSNNPDIATTPT